MRCPVALLFGVALVAASGCRNCDRVESELRAREGDVRELREELERSAGYNQALMQELRNLRGDGCAEGAALKPDAVYPVKTLALGRQTGGTSSGSCPGDDALQVQVEPRDPDGQAIKAPGSLLVTVQEIGGDGLKKPLSTWEISPDQLRRSWRSGLLSTGYSLTLPWKMWPATEKLRVTAQFRLTDGRLFEADKDVTIHLPPAYQRRPLSEPITPPAPEEPVLPPPSRVPSKETGPSIEETAPFRKAAKETGTADSVWHAVPPAPVVPVAEILKPVPRQEQEEPD